jgi:hypothetical protein
MTDNAELERFWKNVVFFELEHYLRFFLKILRQTIKTVITSGYQPSYSEYKFTSPQKHTIFGLTL